MTKLLPDSPLGEAPQNPPQAAANGCLFGVGPKLSVPIVQSWRG
jgi:hypothetical protein